jgi:hypothetical protein
MNRLVLFAIALGASFAFSACCSTSLYHPQYKSAKKYRINMTVGCKDGDDVWNWQAFLISHNYGLQHRFHGPAALTGRRPKYPSGNFDDATAEATMRFQGSGCPAKGIAINGALTFATYLKAVQAGLPDYGWTKPSPECPQILPHGEHHFHVRVSGPHTALTAGAFRDGPMSLGCVDGGNGDVSAWQTFLRDTGWLGAGYPSGDFDTPTQSYTMIFQKTANVRTTALGKVDHPTWLAAKSYGPFPLQSSSDSPTTACHQ